MRAGASPDGWTWVVNAAHGIYRWNVYKQNWEQIPGGLIQVSAASKDRAMGVNSAQQIFLWENNAWRQLPGAATWAATCDNDERWVVNVAGNIYRGNHATNNWVQIPGALKNIDCQNANRVIGTNSADVMFVYENENWQQLPRAATRATIVHDKAYCINSADGISLATSKFLHLLLPPEPWPVNSPLGIKCSEQLLRFRSRTTNCGSSIRASKSTAGLTVIGKYCLVPLSELAPVLMDGPGLSTRRVAFTIGTLT